jgi:hypothetical protein
MEESGWIFEVNGDKAENQHRSRRVNSNDPTWLVVLLPGRLASRVLLLRPYHIRQATTLLPEVRGRHSYFRPGQVASTNHWASTQQTAKSWLAPMHLLILPFMW